MSLYNIICGVNPATFVILPMLGKHPDEYPRFRDCFVSKQSEKDVICIYTRIGGGNRKDYTREIEELRKMEGYINDYDDKSDSTYATFTFRVPEKWEADFQKIKEGKFKEVSQEYQEQIFKVFPKLKEKMKPLFEKEVETK